MRIVRFKLDGRARWGALDGERVAPLADLDFAGGTPAVPAAEHVPLAGLELLAPVAPPRNIFCLGRNYLEHIKEGPSASDGPSAAPVWFTKTPTCLSAPGADVLVDPAVTSQLDWEVELAVVIGRGGKRIPEERAGEHIFGYSVLNDLSARDLQRARGGQWFFGKSLDGLCPVGPCLVTTDEIEDPQSLDLALRVNGEPRQSANTRDMIFSIAAAIADLSRGIALLPGDVIATGTPSGVGMGMKPPQYLKDGDLVEAEVARIGVLRNRIVFERHER